MRFKLVSMLAAVVLLVAGSVAFAAKPIKGAKYTGTATWTSEGKAVSGSISFTVSSTGKSLSFPLNSEPTVEKCTGSVGGFGGITNKVPSTIKIKKNGTFKATVTYTAISGGKTFGTETITGKFLKNGHEKGKITSKNLTLEQHCVGTTGKYSTTG